jgi:hypothetical protein
MLDNLRPKISTRGDVAAASLGFAIGFAVDVFLFPLGVPPGTTAGACATGALGLKNAAQAAMTERRDARKRAEDEKTAEEEAERRKEEERTRPQQEAGQLQERVRKFLPILQERGLRDLADQLLSELELHTSGISSNHDLEAALDQALQQYRVSTKANPTV